MANMRITATALTMADRGSCAITSYTLCSGSSLTPNWIARGPTEDTRKETMQAILTL